jgi:radical SAM superfamily enzyme YgiQ (UPF0313 family)
MTISKYRVRYRPAEDVVAEMRHLLRRYRVQRFYLFDDIFIIDRRQVLRLCDRFEELQAELPFDWHCLARTDILHDGLFERMRRAGCRQVTFGVEHVSDRILTLIEKHTTKADNYRAILAAKRAGLRVRAQLIVGLPGETDETVAELGDFIREGLADSIGVHIFVPLPGSPVWEHPERFDFRFKRDATFRHYQTIGRPGEWAADQIHENPAQIRAWAEHLRTLAGQRNVASFDARWAEKSETARALYVADRPDNTVVANADAQA